MSQFNNIDDAEFEDAEEREPDQEEGDEEYLVDVIDTIPLSAFILCMVLGSLVAGEHVLVRIPIQIILVLLFGASQYVHRLFVQERYRQILENAGCLVPEEPIHADPEYEVPSETERAVAERLGVADDYIASYQEIMNHARIQAMKLDMKRVAGNITQEEHDALSEEVTRLRDDNLRRLRRALKGT